MIKAIIFDCFGVLVGSGSWQLFERAGGDIEKDGAFFKDALTRASAGKLTSGELCQTIADRVGMSVDEYKKIVADDEQPNLDVFTYIETQLQEYKIGLLSNATFGEIDRKIPPHLHELFDVKVLSAEEGIQKPDVEIFKRAADRLAVAPEECVFIDDHEPYLAGAQAIGMRTILFTGFSDFKVELEKVLGAD